jgi:1,4-alpha-glucan branching enzyme
MGDFNGWNPEAHPMQRQPDGAWLLQVPLHHGHHQYRFLVDAKPVLDPRASGVVRDRNGERASLIAVS